MATYSILTLIIRKFYEKKTSETILISKAFINTSYFTTLAHARANAPGPI